MPTDPLSLLREADPVREQPSDPGEADALLRRVLAEPPHRPPHRRPLAWRLAPVAAVALAVVVVAIMVLPGGGGAPARAYAAMTPQEEILHIRSTLLAALLVEKDLLPVNRRLTWEAEDPRRTRTLVTALRPGNREVVMSETAVSPKGTRAWSPYHDEIRVARRPIYPTGEYTAVESFRRLYRAGEISERGQVTVDGRSLIRLSTSHGRRIDWFVDPESYEPTLMRNYDKSGRIAFEERITIKRFPLNDETESLLELSPHPGAEVRRWDGSPLDRGAGRRRGKRG